MRKLLKAIAAMMRRVVSQTIRLANGAFVTILTLLSPPPPPVDYDDADVDDAVARADAVRARDEAHEGLRVAGDTIRRAAAEVLAHGKVLDQSIPAVVTNWISCLSRFELAVLVASTPEDVAKHAMGEIVLETDVGVPISMPNAVRDAARLERRREEKIRREEAYAVASRRTRKTMEPSMAPSLVF